MLIQRRCVWKTFQDLQKTIINVRYNLKFDFPPILTMEGPVSQLKAWNEKYKQMIDTMEVAACHFNRLIILLLDDMPQLSPTAKEQELGIKNLFSLTQTKAWTSRQFVDYISRFTIFMHSIYEPLEIWSMHSSRHCILILWVCPRNHLLGTISWKRSLRPTYWRPKSEDKSWNKKGGMLYKVTTLILSFFVILLVFQ